MKKSSKVLGYTLAAIILISSVIVSLKQYSTGQHYYVSNSGDDNNSGTTKETPWKTIEKINGFDFKPGDVIHFRSGDIWRGQLIPVSGNEDGYVEYTSYGSGEKPVLLGSIDKSNPKDWKNEGNNIWSFSADSTAISDQPITNDKIYVWTEDTANVTTEPIKENSSKEYLRITCIDPGTATNHVQLIISGLKIETNKYYKLSFRANSTIGFKIPFINLMKSGSPWTQYYSSHTDWSPEISAEWKAYSVTFKANTDDDNARSTICLGGDIPKGAVFNIDLLSFSQIEETRVYNDVGNIIFDGGKECGYKVFYISELDKQNKFLYDKENYTVKVYSLNNPAEIYKSIECAVTKNIIEESNKSYIKYSDLALRYGGAHGIGGGDTHHIIVKNCDISYMGGGGEIIDGRRARYGNGIEFWDSAHDNIIEKCRLWEIYDAALTNQGSTKGNKQYNIVYKNNEIWNSEYSFEYWNGDETSTTDNIRFQNNICRNAGSGWGHKQRTDPTGIHICFYQNTAQANNIVISDNTFENAAKYIIFVDNYAWNGLDNLEINRNTYFQSQEKDFASWLGKVFGINDFDIYRSETGKDEGSILNVIRVKK